MKNSHGSMVAVIPAMLLTACVDNRNDFVGAAPSAEVSAASALPAPENLSASASDNEVNLSWDAVDGATAYNVYIYDESGYAQNSYFPANSNTGGFTKVDTNSHLVSSLEYEVDYYFNVTAVADTLESGQSNEVGVRPLLNFSNSTPSMRLLDFNVNAAEIVTLSAEVSDPDGNDINYLWKQTSGDSVDISDSDQAQAYFTAPIADAPVDLGFVLTISDDYGASNSKTTTVSVSDNFAPQVDAGDDQSTSAGNLVNLLGSASDSDGDIAEVTWQLSSGSGVILSGTSTLTTSFVAPSSSSELTLVFQLSVTDDRGASASDTVTITVAAYQEPTIDSAISTSVPENTSGIVYTVSATSSADEVLSYDFSGADIDDFTIDSGNGTIAFSNPPDYENPADSDGDNVYQLSFEVSDSVNTLSQALSIDVTDLDEFDVIAPEDDDSAANEIDENSAANTLVGITASASDADGTNNTITYSFADGTNSSGLFDIDANTGVVSYNGSGGLDYESGSTSYSLDIYAHSSDGSSASASFPVNITDVNEAPVFASTSGSANAPENSTEVFYTASASDEDAGASITYSLASGGADNDLFNLNTASGGLSFKAAPDYETFLDSDNDGVYQVTISASDGSLSSGNDLQLAVSVSDVNEAPTITSATSASTPENTESTTTIYTASATDPENDTLTYSLSGTDKDEFIIDSSSGAISFANTPDHETPTDANNDNDYQIILEVSDDNGNSASQELTITVTDGNEIPTITSATSASILENTSGTIYTASATDPENDTLTYSLSGTDQDNFIIDPSNGAISFVNNPNYEAPTDADTNNVYQVTLEVSDGSNTLTQELTFTVTDSNEHSVSAPIDADGATNQIAENAAAETPVGITVSASDADGTNNTVSYGFTNGNQTSDDNLFSVVPASGIVKLLYSNSLDYETATSHELVIKATSSDGSSATATFTINVTDFNEYSVSAPTDADGTPNQIAEDAIAGTAVGITAASSDADGSATVSYSFDNDNQTSADNLFSIASDTGIVTLASGASLNYETAISHDITVKATSSDGSSTTRTFTVDVTDVNDNAPLINASQSFSVDENSADGASIGTVAATDADLTATTYQDWTIAGGNTNNAFAINSSTGEITVANSSELDYESGATSYTLSLTVSDGTNTSSAETVTINVKDLNDNAPVITSSQLFSVDENSANGASVGTATATDADATATTYEDWKITGGNTNNAFVINDSTGELSVADASQLDYESGAILYTLSLTVSDGANTSSAETVTISVNDLNDNLPIIAASQSFSVDENSANGTSLGAVAATDADATATTYQNWTITGGNTNSAFAIDPDTGEITVNTSSELDTETTPSYSLSITVSDGANTATAETVTININDLNDNTPIITPSQSFDIDEASANDTSLGTVALTDADSEAVNTFTWSITAGNTNDAFAIDPSSGELTVNTSSELDYEGGTILYTLSLTVSDGATTSAAEAITINILDVSEHDAAPSAAYLGLPDNYINITFTPEGGVSYQLHRSFVEGCTSSSCDSEGYKLFASPNSSGTADTMTFSQTHYYSLVGDNSTTFTTSINDSDGAKLAALVAAQSLSTEYDLANDWVNISATDSNNVTYTLYMAGEPFAAGGCEDSELYNIGSLCADGSSLSDGSMHSATEVINWSARRYYRLDISDGYQVVHSLESNASVIDPVVLNASNASLTIDITWSAFNSAKLAEYTVYLSDDSAATTASAATWSSLSNPQIISGNSSELYSLVPILSQYYVAITATNTGNETTPLSKVYLANNIVTGDPDPSTWHEVIADTDDSPAHWEGRSTHGSLVFQDKMWLIGGRTASEAHIAEVWSSTDGYNWTEVNPSAAFGARKEFVSMVHDGKMWVLGGEIEGYVLANDVWYSSDGANWHEATEAASWHARDYFGGVSFASGATGSDEMWVLGHYTGDPRGIPGVEDHHYSTDGSTWSSVSVSGLPPSSFFPAITFNNAILIVGGYFYTNSAWSNSNSIYSSTDGVNWTELSVSGSIWDARRVHSTLVYDDKLWVLAGDSGYNRDDYWYSSDGTQWHEATASGSKWEARSVHTSVNYAGRMWMLGGYGSTGDKQLNDVWASGLEITSFLFNPATTN